MVVNQFHIHGIFGFKTENEGNIPGT